MAKLTEAQIRLSDYYICTHCSNMGNEIRIPLKDFKNGQLCPQCGDGMLWARREIYDPQEV